MHSALLKDFAIMSISQWGRLRPLCVIMSVTTERVASLRVVNNTGKLLVLLTLDGVLYADEANAFRGEK